MSRSMWSARWRWFTSQWASWTTAFVIVAIGIWLCFPQAENHVRWVGLALQCLGMLVLIYGVHKAFERSDRPGLWAMVVGYFQQWPRVRVVEASMNIKLGGIQTNASFTSVPFEAPKDLSLEAITAAMRKNMESTYNEITRRDVAVEAMRRDLTREIKAEATSRDAALASFRSESGDTTVVTGALTLIGTSCLIVGSLLGTLSNEISCLHAQPIVQCAK